MIARGWVGSALVLLGGLVTAVLPDSSVFAHAPLLHTLRETPAGRMAGLVVVMGGLCLLGSAWLRLLAVGDLRLVHRAAAAWTLPLLLAPPLFSRDAWSYAAQGELTRLGLSPYTWTPSLLPGQVAEAVDPMWRNTPTPYGPLPLAWGSFVAGITDNAWLLVIGHRLLAALGLVLLAWAVPRLARRGGQDPVRASALVLACPLTLAHGVGGAHNDLVMAGLMAAALAATFERWWVLGAALGGAAAAVKVPGGIVCIGVALASLPLLVPLAARLRRLTSVALVAIAVLVGSGVALGVGVGWIHALGTPGIVRTPLSLPTQVGSLVETATRIAGADSVSTLAVPALRGLALAVALAAAVWVALRGRTGDPAAAVRTMALLTAALVVLSPAVHGWYAFWCLPFLAACRWGRTADDTLRNLLLLLGIIAPLDSSLRGAPAEITVVILLTVLAAARLRQAERFDRRADAVTPVS